MSMASVLLTVALVSGGQPKTSVVLPADALPHEKTAAEELVKWTKAVTGAEMPIAAEPKAGLIPLRFGRSDRDVKYDGFSVTASSKEIVIAANDPQGILFGVYWLLNRFGGVYWCHPDAEADYGKKEDFEIPDGRIVKTPMQARQGIPSGNGALATPERREKVAWWNVRNGFTLQQRLRGKDPDKVEPGNYYKNALMEKLGSTGRAVGGGHILGELVLATPVDPAELKESREWVAARANELFEGKWGGSQISLYAKWRILVKQHPAWFGLVNGERVPTGVSLRQGTELKGKSSMPCLSNPEVRELLYTNFKSWQAEHYPDMPVTYNLCCDDQSQWCECGNCLKQLKCAGPCDDKDKASDYWWDFVNWFSERALADPLVSLNVYVYRTYQTFPKKVKPIVRDRMSVNVCPHGRCNLHSLNDPNCKVNRTYRDMLAAWTDVGMGVNVFEYMNQTPGKCNYAFWERAWIDDVKWYLKSGVSHGAGGLIGPWDAYSTDDSYFRRNAAKARWQIAWLTGYFEWNPDADFDSVRDTLFRTYYRKAEKPMTEYRAMLEKAIYASGQCMCYGSGGTLFASAAFQPGILENGKRLLDEAKALAKDDPELMKRVNTDAEWFRTNWEAAGISYENAAAEMPCGTDDFRKIIVIRDTPQKVEETFDLPTVLKLSYDKEFLYLECACTKADGKTEDIPPDGATFDAMKGSHLEFTILSPHLNGRYYHIAVSHNGKAYSALTESGSSRDLTKTLDFKPEVTDTPDTWTVKMALPLAAFGGAKPGDLWKVDVSRMAVDKNGKRIRGYGSLCGYGMHMPEYWKVFSFGAPSNLLTNGSFEDLVDPPVLGPKNRLNGKDWTFNSAKMPAGWFYQQNGGIGEAVSEGAADGKAFLRLKGPKRGYEVFLWQDILAYPGGTKKFRFSFKSRGKGVVTARVIQHPKETECVKTQVAATGWQEYTGIIPLGDLHPTRFMINVAADSLDLDDLRLGPMSDSEQDSTTEIQKMLDKAGKVVIAKEGSPWCVSPLKVRSGTDIVFEDGAELRAATNCYFNNSDSVLNLWGVTNVTIRGKGIVSMNKFEYRQKGYKPGDGRHGLCIRGSANVTVEDMTFRDAGADGVYIVGWGNAIKESRGITLKRITCDGCYRQGVSVISVENFLAEECRFLNTKGSSPEAGIDFEPNYPWEKLVNCRLKDTLIGGNAGTGLHISPHWLCSDSAPVSIRVENCTVKDNGYCGIEVMRNGYGKPPQGEVVFEDCLVSGTTHYGLVFVRHPADMFRVVYKNCTVERTGRDNPVFSEILCLMRDWCDNPPGNIVFDNLTIRQAKKRPWFAYLYRGRGPERARDWSGSVRIVSPEGEERVVLDETWMQANFPEPPAVQPPDHVKADFTKAKVVDRHPGEMRELGKVHTVSPVWVFYVDKPKTCRFRMRQIAWGALPGRPSPWPIKIKGITLRGEWEIPQPKMESGETTFEAKKPGFYRFNPITESSKTMLEAADVPMAWYLECAQGRNFCAAEKASLYFVPLADKPFAVITSGKDKGVRLELFDQNGKQVWIDPQALDWNTYVGQTDNPGLWRLDLIAPEVKTFWQSYSVICDLTGTPGCFFLDKDRYWTFEAQ